MRSTRTSAMPMVAVDKDYVFDSPSGEVRLLDLFDGRCQLIVYHFMFDPLWRRGVRAAHRIHRFNRRLSLLAARDSRWWRSHARAGEARTLPRVASWTLPWLSSHSQRLQYDFHARRTRRSRP